MAVSVINGSNGAGTFLENANADVIKVTTALTSMNNPAIIGKLKGMAFLDAFTRTIQGIQGHTEAFKANQAFASDDGSFQDGVAYQESYGHWVFTRRGYTVKDKDFTHKMLLEADERNIPLGNLVTDRISTIMDLYVNKYLPNVAYETLFTLPTIQNGGDYYSEPKGFLMGQTVEDYMLKPGVSNKVRHHYRGISATHGSTGAQATLGIDDIMDASEYLSEYVDISESDIIGIGTRRTLFKLRQTFAYDANKDIFARTGEPAQTFAGVRFITNDYMPKGIILFVDGAAPELITKLVSPKAQYRGMAIVKEDGFPKLEDVFDLVGSKFKIQPEGYHLTGRHYGLFLDIENKAKTVGNDTGVMDDATIKRIEDHAKMLRQKWYRSLR